MRVISSRVVYENRWMRVREDRTVRADGAPGLYAWVEKSPATIVVPIQDGEVWLVAQHRHTVDQRFWEFPQGAWEQAPEAGAEALARGELGEETGLRAGRLEHLGLLYFAYGFSNQSVDVWRATELEPGPQALEATEEGLEVGRFSRAEVDRMIAANEIRDAASVAAWHLSGRSSPSPR